MGGRFDAMIRWWKASGASGAGATGDTIVATEPMAPSPNDVRPLGREAMQSLWQAHLDREGIPRSLRYPTTTLGRMLDQTADRYPDIPALIYDRTHWTYRELLTQVNRMAGGLARLGVRPGDRVAMRLPNCPEYILSFFATQKLGAILVNAGPLMGNDDWRSLVALTKPRIVIGLDLQAPSIVETSAGGNVEHFVWVSLRSYQRFLKWLGYQMKLWQGGDHGENSTSNHTTLAKLLENAPAKPPTVQPSPDAPAVLQPTSGTTGALKLATLSHRNLLANALHVSVWMAPKDGQERVLAALPMFHIYGLMLGLINPIYSAATIIPMTRFQAGEALDLMERHHPTVAPIVPAICDALSNEIESRNPRPALTGLRACISGAAPLPRETAERFERLTGAKVIEGYGLSESSPVTHANLLSRPRYGTIGLPMPDTLCRIVDLQNDRRDLAVGQPGELLIAGPQVMSGYYANPEETRRALVTDDVGRTWLKTGDVVRVDEDGYFQILDRTKDMIIRSGMKVYPAKVETVLAAHAQVSDVAVIGRPDPAHTEKVVAVIVTKNDDINHETLTAELRALCRQHLAAYEVPSDFEFVSRIPRSPLGKVLKKELRNAVPPVGNGRPAVPALPTAHCPPPTSSKEAA